jgi:hypothetical protein
MERETWPGILAGVESFAGIVRWDHMSTCTLPLYIWFMDVGRVEFEDQACQLGNLGNTVRGVAWVLGFTYNVEF